MEFLIVVMILIVAALVVGTAVYLVRELRQATPPSAIAGPSLDVLRVELATHHQADFDQLRNDARRVLEEIESELNRLHDGVRSTHQEHNAQMDRLRDRFVEVDGQTSVQLDRAVVDLRSHHDASIERLREAVGAVLTSLTSHRYGEDAAAERRAAALSGLYRRLAVLESNFVSITNPGLLPGESFALPAAFTPESLVWETWKGFGDSVYSFAETFNEERIHLDDQTCRDIVSFLTDTRHTLTKSVFPSLPDEPGNAMQEPLPELREAIIHLGSELATIRARIEAAYREEPD